MASPINRVRRFSLSAAATAALLLTPGALAQDQQDFAVAAQDYPTSAPVDREWSQDEIPAHLAIVDGEVTLERDGRAEPADENIVLLAGDRLRTTRGRAEVLFADGSALDLDEHTAVDLLSDSLVRLLGGRLRLSIARGAPSLDYRVDTAAGSVFIKSAGDYRVALLAGRTDPELDLAVLRGSAELANEYGRTLVRAGTHALVSARLAPSLPFPANSASWDSFDRWVEDQRDARLGVASTRYLPSDLRYYGGAFDRYGSWGYEPTYGYVWYPTVDLGWRPYSHGRWSFVGHFGWIWVGLDRWSWPTHHYGRWGYRNRWYWIPDRRWSPAWVSWAHAPGYLSWCPLGWDGRPVISITNIHVTRIDPWIGWTVVPLRSFRPNVVVSRYAVARHAASPSLWSQFAVQQTAPVRPANLPVRTAPPLRAPTFAAQSGAVPRDGLRRADVTGAQGSPSTTASGPRGIASARSAGALTTPPASTAGSRRVYTLPSARSTASDTPPRDAPSRVGVPRAQPRAASPTVEQPRATSPSRTAEPSRTLRTREPDAPPASAVPSRSIRSREPGAPPSSAAPSRSIRSREPDPVPPSSAATPWNRSRVQQEAPSAPPRFTPRSAEPPDRAPAASPWMRSGPSGPDPGAGPRPRSGPPRSISPPPVPSSGSRPSGGFGSAPSRMAPRSERSAPPPPSAQAPRGGDSRAPSGSAPSSSGGRGGAAVRRGGER